MPNGSVTRCQIHHILGFWKYQGNSLEHDLLFGHLLRGILFGWNMTYSSHRGHFSTEKIVRCLTNMWHWKHSSDLLVSFLGSSSGRSYSQPLIPCSSSWHIPRIWWTGAKRRGSAEKWREGGVVGVHVSCTVCLWLMSGILKNLVENQESKLTHAEISHVSENNFLKSKSEENEENDMWSP